MNFTPNNVYFKMADAYDLRPKDDKLIICNEGGARAGKTWAFFYFLVAFCDNNRNLDMPLDIFIIRDTLINCRDKTLNEFKRALKLIGIWNNKNYVGSPKPLYNLFGHEIKFRGMEDDTESYPSDILFFNEALDMVPAAVQDMLMRCRMLAVLDWNPKHTAHKLFDMEKRNNAVFIHSTYKDNLQNLLPANIKELEGYNPDILENIKTGTASKWKWEVYGLGHRANREGLVFPNVNWIDEFPRIEVDAFDSQGNPLYNDDGTRRKMWVDDVDQVTYGMDYGELHATAIVKIGVRRSQPKDEIFLQRLFYAPTENSDIIAQAIKDLGLQNKKIHSDNNMIMWIRDLQYNHDLDIVPTKKFDGSRNYWIATIKRFNINVVKDVDFKREQENFTYRVVDGITLTETIKLYDDLWAASGYGTVAEFRFDPDQVAPDE